MKKHTLLIIVSCLLFIESFAQENMTGNNVVVKMSLSEVINMAHAQSLASFKAKNMYLVRYWSFRSYKASKLPSLNLNATPVSYNQTVSTHFNTDSARYEFYNTDQLSSNVGLFLKQNITWTGAELRLNTKANGLKDISKNEINYNSVPFEISIKQPLDGYNEFKWQSKIAPLQFEKAKKQFLVELENMAMSATGLFFNLASREINLKIAETNYSNADTLLRIGRGRFEIGTVTQDELLDLELSLLNSNMRVTKATIGLRQARARLNSYLSLDKNVVIHCIIPDQIPAFTVDVDEAMRYMQENNPKMLGFDEQMLLANQDVSRTRANSGMKAFVNANLGINKKADEFKELYNPPFGDEKGVSVGISMPILDWGERRGQIQMSKASRDETEAQVKQDRIDLEQSVITQILEFNVQKEQVKIAAKADTIAQLGYDVTKQRFMIDKVDVIKLNSARNSLDQSRMEYINALETYWSGYYNIRKITLFDFEDKQSLITELDQLIEK
ncbi:MAG: TolC family protein [Marinilabiliaceae bacterium]|nr:TolC family protein [Marinilabiliaceae bacterium]